VFATALVVIFSTSFLSHGRRSAFPSSLKLKHSRFLFHHEFSLELSSPSSSLALSLATARANNKRPEVDPPMWPPLTMPFNSSRCAGAGLATVSLSNEGLQVHEAIWPPPFADLQAAYPNSVFVESEFYERRNCFDPLSSSASSPASSSSSSSSSVNPPAWN
jgi:hypothetical protein